MAGFDDSTDSSSGGEELGLMAGSTARDGPRPAIESGIGMPGEYDPTEDPDMVVKSEIEEALEYFSRKKANAKLTRGCYCFTVWYVLFIVLVFTARNVTKGFELEFSMKDILVQEEFDEADSHIKKNFNDIGEPEEIWQWMQGPLLNAIGQKDSQEEAFILSHNRLLGSVRLRQVRSENGGDCEITPVMTPHVTGCFGEYTTATRSEKTYGPGTAPFRFNETNSPPIIGANFLSYDSGGFVIDLSYNSIVAAQQIAQLQEDGWIDRQTKAIFVSVNIYNANVNMLLSMTLLIEVSRGGGIVPSIAFRSFPADLYLTEQDTWRSVLQFLFAVSIVILDIQMIATIIHWTVVKRRNVFSWLISPWWNFISLVNYTFLSIAFVMFIDFQIQLAFYRDQVVSVNQDVDFTWMENLGFNWTVLFNLLAGSMFISTFYFFKFLNVNFRMRLLWTTLQRASADLASFMVFFFIIFLAFVASGHLIFGTELESWKNFNNSFFTCFKMLLGDFNYEEMAEEGHRYLAPLFFISFTILNTFILLNMFLAILNAAWDAIQGELDEHATLGEAIAKGVLNRYKSVRSALRSASENVQKPTKLKKSFGADMLKQLDVKFIDDDSDSEGYFEVGADQKAMPLEELGQKMGMGETELDQLRIIVSSFRDREAKKHLRREAELKQNDQVSLHDFMDLFDMVRSMNERMGGTSAPARQGSVILSDADRRASTLSPASVRATPQPKEHHRRSTRRSRHSRHSRPDSDKKPEPKPDPPAADPARNVFNESTDSEE